MKKYEFTGETKKTGVFGNITVKRIKAKDGELGGWIEKEENLPHEGEAWVCGNAEVCEISHILVIGPIGSRNEFTTFFKDNDNEITVKCGCFLGKINEFLDKVQKTHAGNKYALVYRDSAEIAKKQIDIG